MRSNMLVGILRNESLESADKWAKACQSYKIDYDLIDLTSDDWLSSIQRKRYNFFLLKPPDKIERFKILYDERVYIISKILNQKTFPSYEECLLYENKKFLSYFLLAKNIPHPKTKVYYYCHDALKYIKESKYPIVAKTSIGSCGSGVNIITSEKEGILYCKKAFKKKGIKAQFGPNRVTGSPGKWFVKALNNPGYFFNRLKSYINIYRNAQYGYVIFQEFIPHDFEWRIVRIGDSFFGYKKFKVGFKASGSQNLGFDNPPLALLNFIKDISDQNNIINAAFDVFVHKDQFLINEVQTLFGHSKNHILEVDGKAGRYIFDKGIWCFEEGNFNSNESYDLRLQVALEILGI